MDATGRKGVESVGWWQGRAATLRGYTESTPSAKARFMSPLHLLAAALLCMLSLTGQAATRFTHISPESERDPRTTYDRELLRLALDKTRDQFGDYLLEPAPPMTKARERLSMQLDSYPNLFVMDSYSSTREDLGLAYVRFPIHLGIVSYRICFVSPQQKAAVSKVTDLKGLRQFTFGQGKGWLDVDILRYAGMEVVEVEGYEKLFKMVARGRFDLFCRGVSELRSEQLTHKEMTDLLVDDALLIYYPLPRVFYTNPNNREALKRVERGLQLAWQDGSLQALWRKSFGSAIAFAKLSQRRLLRLDNPFLDGISFDYRPYFYNPQTDRFGDY
ncbi:ABC-type amino acid transport substrate-binding protein [Aeromonas veronii]|uniref:ABC-type amino acid transport substrate-binding protein n=2 Tax=Aeromonas veronii TaxID=654 RepID=A0A653L9F6_AERVE|nr:ABC-type amino acid transport substrate-binding protein [Aeromonas veronii]